MKKLIAGASTAGLMATGLVAFSGGAAHAVCGDDYTGPCPPTNVQGPPPKNIEVGERVRIVINIAAPTDTPPKGRVVIRIVKANGKVSKRIVRKYDGDGRQAFVGPRLNKPGKYKVVVKFIPRGKFKADKQRYNIRVSR